MDLFNNKADDQSVAYFHATMVLFGQWLLTMSDKLSAALLVLMAMGERDEAEAIQHKLANTMTDASRLVASFEGNVGEVILTIDGMAVEVIRFVKPHNIAQKELMSNVLKFGKHGADIMETMIGYCEEVSQNPYPKEEVETLKGQFRYFLDKAVATA